MSINREKIIAAVAFLVMLSGLAFMAVELASSPEGAQVPGFSRPGSARKLSTPVYRRFASSASPVRNPFRYSEGWTDLEPPPLAPPPYPPPPLLLPLLSRSPPAHEAGFVLRRLAANLATESEGESGAPEAGSAATVPAQGAGGPSGQKPSNLSFPEDGR